MSLSGEENRLEVLRAENKIVLAGGEFLDISKAQDLHNILKQLLESELPIEIDVSVIERVDAAILQLFCAFVQDASAFKKKICWRQPSKAFIDAIRLLNLQDELALAPINLATNS
jgi:anti-anti-sigma regulatory factor